MFIVLGGLPGSGKSTVAQRLASEIKATYLRVDSIEQAIRSSSILPLDTDMGPSGYIAVCRVAADNLRLGNSVIADSVNPIGITRAAYREIAAGTVLVRRGPEVIATSRADPRLGGAGRPLTSIPMPSSSVPSVPCVLEPVHDRRMCSPWKISIGCGFHRWAL